jgi:hypothetical protein
LSVTGERVVVVVNDWVEEVGAMSLFCLTSGSSLPEDVFARTRVTQAVLQENNKVLVKLRSSAV